MRDATNIPPLTERGIIHPGMGLTSGDAQAMKRLESAIAVIENCHGFDEETSGVGEAWAVVKSHLPNVAFTLRRE